MAQYLTIGEAAKRVGLSTKTIRYYESIDLLQKPDRNDNGYRSYSPRDIQTLALIKQTKGMGVSLSEIKKIITVCNNESCDHAKSYIKNHLSEYIASVQQKIQELESLKSQLNALDVSLAKTISRKSEKNCCELAKMIDSAKEVSTMCPSDNGCC